MRAALSWGRPPIRCGTDGRGTTFTTDARRLCLMRRSWSDSWLPPGGESFAWSARCFWGPWRHREAGAAIPMKETGQGASQMTSSSAARRGILLALAIHAGACTSRQECAVAASDGGTASAPSGAVAAGTCAYLATIVTRGELEDGRLRVHFVGLDTAWFSDFDRAGDGSWQLRDPRVATVVRNRASHAESHLVLEVEYKSQCCVGPGNSCSQLDKARPTRVVLECRWKPGGM